MLLLTSSLSPFGSAYRPSPASSLANLALTLILCVKSLMPLTNCPTLSNAMPLQKNASQFLGFVSIARVKMFTLGQCPPALYSRYPALTKWLLLLLLLYGGVISTILYWLKSFDPGLFRSLLR